MAAAVAAIELAAAAGIDAIRRKSKRLTSLLIDRADAVLGDLEFQVGTPRLPEHRGGHVSLRHVDAFRICRALITGAAVVPDFRAPEWIRLGPSPLYTRFVDVWDGVDRVADVVRRGHHLAIDPTPTRIT